MTSINNVINVTLQEGQQLALADNMNTVAIMTDDRTVLNSANRYKIYSNYQEVVQDFGSNSDVTKYASVFFAQSPNPINAGGALVVGYWRSSSETVAATAGRLVGAQLQEANVIAQLQQISAGTMSITIDGGSPLSLTGLNFSAIATMADAVTILDAAITGATVAYNNMQLTITSATTGASSSVSYVTGTGANFVGNILGLVANNGAISIPGVAAATLAAELETDALNAVQALIKFRGFMFIPQSTNTNRIAIATWCQANKTLGYDVFSDPNNLTRNVSVSPAWQIKLSGLTNYRMQFSTLNDRLKAVAYMSRAHVVNFNGQNTAITMNLKTLSGVVGEDYTDAQVTAAKSIGLDLYTVIKNVSCVISSYGNDFTDNRYNLLAFVEAATVDAFNVLRGTPTKIGQTTDGVDALVTGIAGTIKRFINANVFGAGTWTDPSTIFGNPDAFNRAIEQQGYYILPGLLSAQSPADRQLRKSPVIQVAVKNVGAIESADFIVNFNL